MMSLSLFFSRLEDWVIYFGMPVVTCYHLLCSNVFLNTAAEDAQGLEKMGNVLLSPFRYLFAGHNAVLLNDEKYEIKQYFDYEEHLFIKTTGALISLPLGVFFGSTLKALAFLSPDVRARHRAISTSSLSAYVIPNNDYYQKLFIDSGDNAAIEKISSLGYARQPGDDCYFSDEKKAFGEVVRMLKEHKILFWADCGTCLGAYRYGGIIPWDNDLDMAILEADFSNVKRILSALDSKKYLLEDWSNRCLPQTYLRLYIRSTRQYIDIYTFAIFPEKKAIRYICSNQNSMFMPDSWKINERHYQVETPFDVVFPLRLADFDGIEVPVPNQIEKYLQMRYGDNLAPVKIYNSASGCYEKDLSHPYWQQAYMH